MSILITSEATKLHVKIDVMENTRDGTGVIFPALFYGCSSLRVRARARAASTAAYIFVMALVMVVISCVNSCGACRIRIPMSVAC